MDMKTRLSKLEKAEHERLCGEVLAAEEVLKTLVTTFFNKDQLRVFNILWLAGDDDARELPEERRQELYVRRRQQATIEQLCRTSEVYQRIVAELQALQAEGAKNETT